MLKVGKAVIAVTRSRPRTAFFLALVSSLAALVAGCLGNDFRSLPLGVERWDHGWHLAIEPDEEFGVDLIGSNAFPARPWRAAEFDTGVLRLSHEEREGPRSASGDPDESDAGDADRGPATGVSLFRFVDVAVGRTPLRFELVADGQVVNIAEYTVEVVEDACAAGTSAVANRCGGDGFTYHPQMLHERDVGADVRLEAGTTTRLVLTANALHQDVPWTVVAYDDSVISVQGPVDLGPARELGDFSEVASDTSHSFLPAWEFTITGLARGKTTLALELTSAGQPLDAYTLEVEVTRE